MAAQVELEAVRPCMVGSRLHLSPLIDSSNKNFMDGSGGPQGSVIISSEPRKPIPAPKPRLSPKPFTVEKNPTIRPILAPKPQPKPRNESTLPTFYKPDLPSALKPQSTGKPSSTLGSSNWSSGLKTGQTNKTQSFKPALPFTSTDSNKSTQTKDVFRRKSFGAALANTKSGLHSSNTNAEWPFPSQTRQPGSNITRAKSLGFLSEVGLNYEENKQDDTRTENEIKRTPTVLRPQYKGSRPRPVSAVFAPCPPQPETQVGSSTPVPHWVERRPLSSDLTSKFGSTGLSAHRQHTRSDCKENTPASCAGRETRGENAESQNKFPETVIGSIKAEPNEDDSTKAFKPEDEGGNSIKKRISLLLDSSSSYSAQTDAQIMDQRLSAQTSSENDGKVGVKQRIKELSEEAPAAPTAAQRPQYKPRQLHSDRGKRFEADLDHLKSIELKEAIDVDDGFKTKSECSSDDGQLSKQEDSKASSLFVDGLSTNSGLYNTGVQTVRAAVFEHVVERHSVHVMEDSITQGQPSQKETRIKPMPRRNHSLRIRGDPLMGADDGDPYSLVKATYREQVSPSSPKRVDHVFDMVSLSGESRAVSEALPVAQLEDKALTLRSRRSASQSELDKPTTKMNQPLKDEEIKSFVPLVDTQNPRFLRVGALPKWPEGNREIDIDRERQKEMVRKMEEDIQKQVELHKVRVADLEEDEKHGEPEWKKGMDAQTGRQREHEAGKHIQSKTLKIEDQINKPRATYFALTGQIQEPVYQGEKMDETSEKWWMLDSEERGIKDKGTFDDFSVKTVQWASPNPISLFQRNSSLDAAMQRDLSEDQLGTNVGQRTEHSLKGREQKQVKDDLEIERKRLAELEKMRHLEMELELKKQRQKEIESEKRKEIESQKEKQRQKDLERQQELDRRREVERQKREKERQKQVDYERIKAAERELEQQREFERRRQKEIEREKQRMLDQEMLRIMEYERQREMEREKERQLELERRREVERQRQKELEKQREIERQKELERQKFLERQQQLEKQKELEKERQRQMERQQELNRKREIERQRELEREQERQKELERQKQRERELDRYKQQKADEREKKRELEELERIKELERQQLLDYELQKHRQQEQEKKRTKQKREREVQQPEGQQRAETTKRTPTSPLRPKVLDLDSVSLGVRTGQSSLDISPTARWKQPLLHPDEVYKPAILDIDSFQSQADLITGFGSLGSGVGLGTQSRCQSITTSPQNSLQPQASFQPSDLMRLQLPPPLQPQVLHKSQPNSLQFGGEKPKAQPQSMMESTNFGIKQPVLSLPYMQTNIWGPPQSELAVDEPLWVSTMEGSRRPISTRPSGPDSHFLGQDDKGFISTSTSASSVSPVFLSSLHPQAQTTVPSQTPAPQSGQPVFHPILTPERCWPSGPMNAGSSAALSHFSAGPSARIDVPISRIDVPIFSSQGNKISVADPIWSPNWELVSQGPRENRTSHRDKVQQKRSRSMCRRSAPTDGSTDDPVVLVKTRRSRSAHKERHGEDTDLLEKCVGGQQQHKDTDNLVQETDSQYGTWETGLHTDDSLSATPSSECIITPSPRKPSPPQTTEQNLLIDVPDCSAASPPNQTDLLFPETPTTLLDSSALRARVSLNKRSTRRAPPSRTTRHSSALSQVLEGSAAEEEEDWRFKDSTEEKAESKPAPESDSEEQAKGIETRTSSVSQAQRVAVFPGMDPSALKVQLKKRGEPDHQTDGPSPTPLPRSPKSPFLPRASRVLPPVGGKENGEESSPQWLKELKTKKRLSQYESDNTA